MASAGLTELSFMGGVLAGFASSLHCVGMCGGIAASISMSHGGGTRVSQARALLLAQAGRILAYVTAGAMLASLGAQTYLDFDREAAHLVLRWAAAVVLAYIGLSVAGWAPALARFDRLGGRVVAVLRAPFSGALVHGGPVAFGFVWGFLPCGIVYAMLFYAMLSADAGRGALIMLGFGLGTLPTVTFAAFGAGSLLHAARHPRWRVCTGIAILSLAFASVLVPPETIRQICGLPPA